MAFQTKIQWTDHTFNGWLGCSKDGEGCKHCYAEAMMDLRYGRVKWGPQGTRSLTSTWHQPVAWNRLAREEERRHKVFAFSLADVFEDYPGQLLNAKGDPLWHRLANLDTTFTYPGFGKLPDALPCSLDWARGRLFRLIDNTPFLDYLLLTKRPENIRAMWHGEPRKNVWLGTSISNQREADVEVPRLISCTGLGALLFLSVEPQIGRIDLSQFLFPRPLVDWVIVGGESNQGHGVARAFNLDWARLLRDQCESAGVPLFFKQAGSNPRTGTDRDGLLPLKLVDSHGGNWEEWPADLRVRQCPETFFPQLASA